MNWQEKRWRKKNLYHAKRQDAAQRELNKICGLFRNGKSQREIAEILLLPERLVGQIISQFKLRTRYKNNATLK